MKTRTIILLVFMSVAITAGGITFGYLISQNDEPDKPSPRTTSQPNDQTSLTVSSSGGVGQLSGNGDSAQVNGATDNTPPRVPTPDEFEIYEQYAGETSALFGEVAIGNGNEPKTGDTVAVIYQGWLTDGTLFDSSPKNDQGQIEAFSFRLGAGEVIRGWDQGISGMKVGGKRRLVIPPSVGYGENGQGPIPPNAILIFDVELVQIIPAETPSGL